MSDGKNSYLRQICRVLSCALAFAAGGSKASGAATPTEPLIFSPQFRANFDAAAADATAKRSALDGAPAVVVAIVQNGAIVYARAAGSSDIGKNIAATTDTRFRAGSITKMFTAVAVMQLVESGRITLDERLATYLPNAPHAKEVTIRQLLTHTSGIANYADAAIASGAARKPTTPQGIIDGISAKPLEFVPGHKYAYSNTGYVLLGQVVESISQGSLAAYERQNIFARAGMTQTTSGIAAGGVPTAVGYVDARGIPAVPVDPTWLYAGGDALTTAPDLARFDIALMAGKLVAPATLLAMLKNDVLPDAGRSYGLGLTLRTFGDLQLAGHHGGLPGFEASDEMLPTQGFGIVVIGNAFRFDTERVEMQLLEALLPTNYAAFAAAERQRENVVAASADPKVTAALRGLLTGLLSGTLDRRTLSLAADTAFTSDVVAKLHAQFTKLGALKTLVFRGKAVDGVYDVYEYAGTFASDPQTIPLRLIFDGTGKIAGFFQA